MLLRRGIFFKKRSRYRKVNATVEFRTKGKPSITLFKARKDVIDRLTAEMKKSAKKRNRNQPCRPERGSLFPGEKTAP